MFEYVDRQKGVQLAHDIYHHAKANNSNVGMYFATFTLGTIREQSQLALQRADKLIHQHNKCAQKASIYEHMGDYREALYWQKRTRAVIDSIQSSEARSQMNEFDTELSITYAENETKEQELAKEQTMLWAGGTIAALIIVFLALYGYRCYKHTKRMKSVNSRLQQAYDQLEVTTKAKERIESELRIAREIQRRMLPHVFPRRRDVDISILRQAIWDSAMLDIILHCSTANL